MDDKWKLTLHEDKSDRGITFKELYESMVDEIEVHKKIGILDQLMEQKVMFNLVDCEGQTLYGDVNMFVGFLEGGDVLLTGSLKDVHFIKEVK